MENVSPRTVVQHQAAHDAIVSLSARALPPLELLRQVAVRLRPLLAYRGGGWLLTDPATLLNTAVLPEEVSAGLNLRLVEHEIFGRDLNSFRALARSRSPAAALSITTGGELHHSTRHRTLYAPNGYGDELRAVFRTGRTVWGQVCLARAEGEAPFSPAEVALLRSISAAVGAGIRTGSRLFGDGQPPEPAPPGVVVLDDADQVESLTEDAAALLAPVPQLPDGVPIAVHEVAHRARARAAGHTTGAAPTARLWSPAGWLSLHGARLGPARTAVVIEPVRRAELSTMVAQLYGLTEREREVAALWVQGLSVEELARRLIISPHTVHDHVKAVYAKLGVRSRGELTATLLLAAPPPVAGS